MSSKYDSIEPAFRAKDSDMIVLVAYVLGLAESGVLEGIEDKPDDYMPRFPRTLHPQLKRVMEMAADMSIRKAIYNGTPQCSGDPFEVWNIWHKATNITQFYLNEVYQRMDDGSPIGDGFIRLPVGHWSFVMFKRAAKAIFSHKIQPQLVPYSVDEILKLDRILDKRAKELADHETWKDVPLGPLPNFD